MGSGLMDRLLGDLMKDDASHGLVNLALERLHKMPTDGLSFAILISRDPELVAVIESCLQLFDNGLLLLRHLILWRKSIVRIDTKFALRKISDMSHARLHREILPEKPLDGPGLRGAFDDDEMLGHSAGG